MDICKIQVGILKQFKNTYIHNKKIFVILKLKLMYMVTINKTNKLNIIYYIIYCVFRQYFNFNFVFLYYPDSQFLIIMSRFTQI